MKFYMSNAGDIYKHLNGEHIYMNSDSDIQFIFKYIKMYL